MKRRIIVETGVSKEIAETLGCTKQMVSYALNFKKNSPLAKKIRAAAVNGYGGIDTNELKTPKKQAV